jgi:hypothetical protein
MAAHNTGGIVIVQVERLVAAGTLPSRAVQLPGAIVDKARPSHPPKLPIAHLWHLLCVRCLLPSAAPYSLHPWALVACCIQDAHKRCMHPL